MPLAPYTDPTLYEGILLVPFAYFARKYNLYQKLKSNKTFFERFANFTFYEWLSISALVAFSLIMLLYTNFTNGNIVLWRVATGPIASTNLNYRGAGHYLVWVALFLIYVRYGALDVLKGTFTMLLMGSLHEGFWYLAYLYARPDTVWNILWYYSPFTVFTYGCIFAYLILFRNTIPKRKVLIAISFIITFYVLWDAIGFPISIDNVTGPTIYYTNLMVNFIENASWLGLAFLLI